MADFLREDIICLYGYFGKLVIDWGSENKETVEKLANKYKVKKVIVSVYHSKANGMIKPVYKSIVDALSKM